MWPALLLVPSIFLTGIGYFSFLVPSLSFLTVARSMKFSIAPLLTRARCSWVPLKEWYRTGTSIRFPWKMKSSRMCKVPAKMANCAPEHNPSLIRASKYLSLFPFFARILLVSFISASKVVGSRVTLIWVGAGGVCVEVLGVSVFKCRELADFLSFGEWP